VLSTNVAWCGVAVVIGVVEVLQVGLRTGRGGVRQRDSVRSASASGEPESRMSRSWGAAGVAGGREELKKETKDYAPDHLLDNPS
jgi:hypothetical protein